MSNIIEQRKRSLEQISSPEQIQYLLTRHLKGKSLFLKGRGPAGEVNILSVEADNSIQLQAEHLDLEPFQSLVFFRILGRYIHIECKVLEKTSPGVYRLQVEKGAIAAKDRKSLRIPSKDESTYITNIRTSKDTIEVSSDSSIPAAIKVLFATAERGLKGRFDFAKVDIFDRSIPILEEIRSTGRLMLLTNTQVLSAYTARYSGHLNYAHVLDTQIQDKMNEYAVLKIRSELIVPIIYVSDDDTATPLGYIQLHSISRAFGLDDVEVAQQAAASIVERIRAANTVLVRKKQQVINLSNGGIKVNIDDDELRGYLARQSGFTFDLFFKGQAPITMQGMICSSAPKTDSLILGLRITGNSARKGEMKRYYENISYREKVIMQLIQKKRGLVPA